MPREASDFTVYQKKSNGKLVWSVYYRDPISGERLPSLSLPKLKRMMNKGREGKQPIRDKAEASVIADRALRNAKTKDVIFKRKHSEGILVASFFKEIWDYDSSAYIKMRKKENNPMERSTCEQIYNCFVRYGEKLLPEGLTLQKIDETNGVVLTEFRDKLVLLDGISASHKNKILQGFRTAIDYAYKRGKLKGNYKGMVDNIPVHQSKKDILSVSELNELLVYLNRKYENIYYERWKYLVCAISAMTGLRMSEVRALKKKDISIRKEYDCAILEVGHAIKDTGEYGWLKEDRKGCGIVKYVAIYTALAEELLNFCDLNPMAKNITDGEQYVFWDFQHNLEPISKDKVKKIVPKALLNVDFETKGRNISFKSLRSYVATYYKNIDDKKLALAQEALGHSSSATTDKYYAADTVEGAVYRFVGIKDTFVLY